MESAVSPAPDADSPAPQAGLVLRVWPAIAIVAAYWIAILFTRPIGGFVTFVTLVAGGLLALVLLVVWWVTGSRARWFERLILGGLALGGIVASNAIADPMTIGVPWIMFIAPWIALAWAAGAWWLRAAPPRERTAILAAILAAGFALPLVVRFEGVTGAMDAAPRWRWAPTPEDRFLTELAAKRAEGQSGATLESPSGIAPPDASPLVIGPGDWPEFRGPKRDATVRGIAALGEWSETSPPVLLWKRRVGPAWSSIAVVGERLFTQEQRGEEELVSCYSLSDGHEEWIHAEADRFQEPAAGTGPRATPTVAAGKIFALTARGVLVCLAPQDGALEWKRDLRADTGAAVPIWGFSSSPLVVPLPGGGHVVACITCGPDGKGVIACDAATGATRWTAGGGRHTYASCHLVNLGGEAQIVAVTDEGLEAFAVADGRRLWEHRWVLAGQARMLQPQVVGDDRLLIHSYLDGAELVRVVHTGTDWTVEPLWRTKELRSYFNDSVVRDGYLYGFNDRILTCIDLATGKRKWIGGRYAHGQVLLVADAGELLVIGEQGEAVRVAADPGRHEERGRFQAVEGKTWNHPTIAHGRLLVRNSEEMACYQLPSADGHEGTLPATPPTSD
jgi:outer membrane protein assembly factor BamB